MDDALPAATARPRLRDTVLRLGREVCPPIVWRGLRRVAGRRPASDLYDYLRPEHFLDAWREIERALDEHRRRLPARPRPRFLDIGGRTGSRRGYAQGFEYHLLDLAPRGEADRVFAADICACPDVPDASYDVCFSVAVFEHVRRPWDAAREIGRILRPGGLAVTHTVFAWEYHDKPVDFWRYTHLSLPFLFQAYGGLETVRCGYDITGRWRNRGTDYFQEHWWVIHVARKPLA